eukprot:8860103-Pyramimonas_sp.AAC.2
MQLDPYYLDFELQQWCPRLKRLVAHTKYVPVIPPHEILWALCHAGETMFNLAMFGKDGNADELNE